MEYTIIVNDRSYDLPKKTLAVVDELDKVLKVDTIKGLSVKERFERLHSFIKMLVGDENAEEMFGTNDFGEIDFTELTLTLRKIVAAYDKPITDYETAQQVAKINDLPIDKIISMANAAQKMAAMPLRK